MLFFIVAFMIGQTHDFEEHRMAAYDNPYEWYIDTDSPSLDQWLAKEALPVDSLKEIKKGVRYRLKIHFPRLKDSTDYHLRFFIPYNEITFYRSTGKPLTARLNHVSDTSRFVDGQYDIKIRKSDLYDGKYLYASIRLVNDPYTRSRFYFQTYNEKGYAHEINYIHKDHILWNGFTAAGFFGAVLIVLLYVIVLFSYDRKALYLYYILYLITIGTYLTSRSLLVDDYIDTLFRSNYTTLESHISYTLQYLSHFAYLWFSFLFLRAKEDYPLYYRVGKVFGYLILLLTAITVVAIECWPDSRLIPGIFWGERLLGILCTFLAQVYVFIKRKNTLALFIVVGSFCFLSGAALAISGYNISFMRLGTLLEILTFSLGLAYRIRITEKEKQVYQQKLIEESQAKEELQRTYNEQLQLQVKERSSELLQKQKLVDEEKKRMLKLTLEREIDRVRMIALRTQMKPHFLFNVINSIRALVIKKDTSQAYEYLLLFSKLIRYILEKSDQDTVALSEEIEMLNIYIALEKLRLSDDFYFRCDLSDQIHTNKVRIPPLILQPFIENAILHGLSAKKGDRELVIQIRVVDQQLQCIVTDNGVGRNHKKEQEVTNKKPLAIELTQNRIDLLMKQEDAGNKKIEILDLTHQDGSPSGTQVRVWLPLIYH